MSSDDGTFDPESGDFDDPSGPDPSLALTDDDADLTFDVARDEIDPVLPGTDSDPDIDLPDVSDLAPGDPSDEVGTPAAGAPPAADLGATGPFDLGVVDPISTATLGTGDAWLDDLNGQILTEAQFVEDFAAQNGFTSTGLPTWETALAIGEDDAARLDPYNSIPGGHDVVANTVEWMRDLNGGTLPPSSGVYGPEIFHQNTGLDGDAAPGWNIYDYYYDEQQW